MLIRGLRHCPRLTGVPRDEVRAFRELLPAGPPHEDDFAVFGLNIAEVLRVTGDEERASALLARFEMRFLDQGNPFAVGDVLEAWGRLDWKDSPLVKEVEFAFEGYPTLSGVLMLRQAQRLAHHEEVSQAEGLVAKALGSLRSEDLPTRWLAEALAFRAHLSTLQHRPDRAREAAQEARACSSNWTTASRRVCSTRGSTSPRWPRPCWSAWGRSSPAT